MIFRTSQMSLNTFLSLSDETKIKMHTHQYCVPAEEWDEVDEWMDENIFGSYSIEIEGGDDDTRWILIYEETDAMAFKLRWL